MQALAAIADGKGGFTISELKLAPPEAMELFEWDRLYINPLYGQSRPFIDFPALMQLYHQKLLKLDEMVTRTYRLENLAQAFEDMHQGLSAKGVLIMDEAPGTAA